MFRTELLTIDIEENTNYLKYINAKELNLLLQYLLDFVKKDFSLDIKYVKKPKGENVVS